MSNNGTIIVDLDGTLALIDHRVHHVRKKPKDFKRFFAEQHKDLPRMPLVEILSVLSHSFKIIIFTARPERYRSETIDWIIKHKLPVHQIRMRPEGHSGSDVEVKKEMYEEYMKENPDTKIVCVFDDRQGVVDYWRSIGLDCYQVQKWEEYKEGKE